MMPLSCCPEKFPAVFLVTFFIAALSDLRAQIEPAADAPQPLAPEASLEHFSIREGFRIELVASEPALADPAGIAWDANGRMFVCEIHGYNLEGHLDIVELNKKGVLDRQVRRIPATPEARKAALEETYGTVKELFDTDGDGRVDRVDVWADRLPPCYGMIAVRDGLIVICAPHIIFLADRDGDGVAEVREKLFTGFGEGALERGINNPRWGLDGWIYIARGRGGKINGPHLARPVEIGNSDFRILPDGSAIEPVAGACGTFGMTMTDFGQRFILGTSNHADYAIPLPHRYMIRNPWVPNPSTSARAANYSQIFPTSKAHPWRQARSEDPAWVRFYGQHETTPSGYFTSACGQMIYRADGLPEEFRGDHFCCDPQNNLVHHSVISRDGAGFRVRRAPGEEKREFLTSSEKWFRPSGLVTGPDGAIWIVDMYREIIEDYSAIPRFLQQQYGLVKGDDRGRIWRVTHETTPSPPRPQLGRASVVELVHHIGDASAWWRETAQRLLVERGDLSAVPLLRRQVREGKTAPARIHALYTLEGLGAIESADVARGLRDVSYGVRVHALRLADQFLDVAAGDGVAEGLVVQVAEMISDTDPAVRLQVAMTLGASRDPRALDALAGLAVRRGNDPWMAAAIASSIGTTAAKLLTALVARGVASDEGRNLGDGAAVLELAAATVGARRVDQDVDRVLAALADSGDDSATERALKGLAAGLRRRGIAAKITRVGHEAVGKLLAKERREVRHLALEIVGLLGLRDSPLLVVAFDAAATDALDANLKHTDRLASIRLLASASFDRLSPVARRLLQPEQPVDLQLAAVAALAASSDAGVSSVLLAAWSGLSPRVRSAVLEATFERGNRIDGLLDAIEEGVVRKTDIRRLHRLQLVESGDSKTRERARALLGDSGLGGRLADESAVTDDVFERYAAALGGDRDAGRGKIVFKEQCLRCHKVGNEGHAVGPDLRSERERADQTLLNDLLAPSSDISAGYDVYVVVTRNGRILNGVLASESATSVTLRQPEGVEQTVLRKNIRSLSASEVSLMPDNLATLLKPQDVADLIAYLRSTFGERLPGKITLFDDEAEFVTRLDQGGGKARLDSMTRFAGTSSLAISPSQRYSDRIEGWAWRIVEHPAPGEFRYLRLAWKTQGGKGVLIELAADGGWPRPDDSRRRYYSGENTTKWQARRVSEEAPGDWTVITVDLWKDCGSFTLTGIAPTAMGGIAYFDRIELLRSLQDVK